MAVDSKILEILSEDAIERGHISKPHMVEWLLDTFIDGISVSAEEIYNASQKLAAQKYVIYSPLDNAMGTIKLTQDGYDHYLSEKYKPKIGFN